MQKSIRSTLYGSITVKKSDNIRICVKKSYFDQYEKRRRSASDDPKREIEVMKEMRGSSHVIYSIDDGINHLYMWVSMEFFPLGDICDFIKKKGIFSEDESRVIFHQMLDGINDLRSHGYANLDVSPENIAVRNVGAVPEEWNVVIIDLGSVILCEHKTDESFHEKLSSFVFPGKESYQSPEVAAYFGGKRNFTFDLVETQVWSMASILYSMTTGQNMYRSTMDVWWKAVISGEWLTPEFKDRMFESRSRCPFEKLSNPLLDLLDMMVKYPNDRIPFEKIINTQWMTK